MSVARCPKPSPARLHHALSALTAALFVAVCTPAVARAAVEGPTVQAYDSIGDKAAGATAYASDLLSVRYEGTRYDDASGQPRLKVRVRGSKFGKVAAFLDTDRDGDPDRLITLTQGDAAAPTDPVYGMVGTPTLTGNGLASCTAAGFTGPTRTETVTPSQSGSDFRVDFPLTDEDLGKGADAGAGIAPFLVAVSLSDQSDADTPADWLPNAAAGTQSCTVALKLSVDLTKGIDRLQTGTPQTNHLIDRAGDGDAGAGGTDILSADLVQWSAGQFTTDPTSSATQAGTTGVHPADLNLTFAATSGGGAVRTTALFFDGWIDSLAPTAPIGAVRLLSGGAGYVQADFYVKSSGGAAAASCQADVATTAGLSFLRSMRLATSTDGAGRVKVSVPLDIALGVFNGAGTDRPSWRALIVGEKNLASSDFVPDTAGTGSCTPSGGVAGSGYAITPDSLPLVRSTFSPPKAVLTATPSTAPRPADIALATTGSTVAAGSARISIDGTGTGTFTAGASRTLAGQRSSGTARVIVEDPAGGIDMASATYTLTNAAPVARVTPSPAEVVIPRGGAASITLSGATSSDPDAAGGGNGIASYSWQLLRGGVPTGATSTAATFTTQSFQASDRTSGWLARLRVTDADGATHAVDHPITLTRGPWAKVERVVPNGWSVGDPTTLHPGDTATFVARSQDTTSGGDAGPFVYDWDFDGNGTWDRLNAGNVATGVPVPAAGSFTAKVRVTDARGTVHVSTGSDAFTYVVTPPGLTPPTAKLAATTGGQSTPPAKPRSGQDAVTLNAAGSRLNDPDAAPTRFRWDFGDGSPLVETTTASTTHTYAGSGPVTASVTVLDDRSGQLNASQPATVAFTVAVGSSDTNAPSAKLVRQAPSSGSTFATRPVTIAATEVVNKGTGALAWAFDLDGNGSFETDTGTDGQVTTTYATPGTRQVRARVTDGDGRVATTAALELEVKAAPTNAPTAKLSAPASLKLTGGGIDIPLDATGSAGNNEDPALTYAFDLDANGTYETDTGSTPTASARVTARGVFTFGVKVSDVYGNTATATREVGITSEADQLAGCVGNTLLRTVQVGPIKAAGCFARIDRGNAGPLFIASGEVDLSGIKISGASGSTVTPREFPDCESKDCQDAEAAFNAKNSSASIALDLSAGHLWSSRPVAMRLQGADVNLPLSLGALDLELPFGKGADGFTVRLPGGASLLGLPVQGEAEVRFPSDGVTSVDVNVKVPAIIGGLTSRVAVEARSGEGVRLNDLSIRIDLGFLSKVVKLKRLWIDYSRSQRLWEGQTIVSLPIGTGFDLTAAIRIKEDTLQSLYGEVGSLNRHLGKGIFLQDIRAGFAIDPPQITGGIGVSVGPRLRVTLPKLGTKEVALVLIDGNLNLKLPAPGQPFVFGIAGQATLMDMFPIADASLAISENGLTVLHAGIGGSYKVGFFRATLDGWISSSAFNAEGNASAGVVIAGKEVELVGASAVASTVGVAACGRVPVIDVGGGIGYKWSDGFSAFTGCDLGPYRASRPADLPNALTDILAPATPARRAGSTGPLGLQSAALRAAQTRGHRVVVPAGTKQLSLKATGVGGAPQLAVATGSGRKLLDTATDEALTPSHLVVADADTATTSVILKNPPAGTLWVAGSGASALRDLQTAFAAPTPRVRATVTGTGPRRTLRWTASPKLGRGQKLVLAEVATGGAGRQLVTTSASSGKRQFSPVDGAGRRTITATVLDADGLARRGVKRVGRFTVRADRPAAPAGLRLRRTGRTVKATWTGKAPAGYEVVATSSTGVQQAVPTTERSFTFPELPQSASAAIEVTAIGRQRERSSTARASLASAQNDSRTKPSTAGAKPRSVRAQARGKGLNVRWRAGRETVRGWRVTFRARGKGASVVLLLPAAARSADFQALAPKAARGGRVQVSALRFGDRRPASATARVR